MNLKKITSYLFLTFILIKIYFHLLFSMNRKPMHSHMCLIFHSCHPVSVKRGILRPLVDRAFSFWCQEFIDSNYCK